MQDKYVDSRRFVSRGNNAQRRNVEVHQHIEMLEIGKDMDEGVEVERCVCISIAKSWIQPWRL